MWYQMKLAPNAAQSQSAQLGRTIGTHFRLVRTFDLAPVQGALRWVVGS
jgi:hypothetical protein